MLSLETNFSWEHTAFIIKRGLYYYNVMPFNLKNIGATYQRLMNKMFKSQIGCNVEVYVDKMLVKSRHANHHLRDLKVVLRAPGSTS